MGWRTGRETGFNWEVRAPGDRMASTTGDEKGPANAFLEMGRAPPGGHNIEEGWQCAVTCARCRCCRPPIRCAR